MVFELESASFSLTAGAFASVLVKVGLRALSAETGAMMSAG